MNAFCILQGLCQYENSHAHTSRTYVAAANLFLKFNFILVCGMFFLIDGALKLAYYFRVLQNLLFFLPHKSAIMENTRHRINQFQLFYFDKSNQIKFSREIIRYQGYFFKIALGTRV